MSAPLRQRVFALLFALVPVCALAQPEAPKRVLLEAVGEPQDVKALEVSLADWLEAMQLKLETVSALPPVSEPSFARVRAVWTDTSCLVEVFSGQGVLRRRKELPRGGPPLLVSESAALIAQAGVQELSIEERKRTPLPAPTEGVAPLPLAEPENLPPFGLRFGAWGQGRVFGETAPVLFGGGVDVSATFGDASWRPGVTLLVGYQGPVSSKSTLFTITLQAVELRLLPTVKRRLGAFEVEFGLGGGFDLLVASTTSDLGTQFVNENRVDPAPFFTAAVGARWMITSSTSLFLRAVVDVDPARRVYVARIGGERETHLVPWIGRPALQVGFSFDILSRPERSP